MKGLLERVLQEYDRGSTRGMPMNPPARNFKQQAHELIEQLPDAADWKDLAHEASVLQDLEEALRDSDADRVVDNAEVRRRFGLPE